MLIRPLLEVLRHGMLSRPTGDVSAIDELTERMQQEIRDQDDRSLLGRVIDRDRHCAPVPIVVKNRHRPN